MGKTASKLLSLYTVRTNVCGETFAAAKFAFLLVQNTLSVEFPSFPIMCVPHMHMWLERCSPISHALSSEMRVSQIESVYMACAGYSHAGMGFIVE